MPNVTRAEWDFDKAAHLLNRAGFGHNGTIRRTTGRSSQIEALVGSARQEPADLIEKLFPRRLKPMPRRFPDNNENRIRGDWIHQMLRANGRRTVQEKMVLFLHGHFTTQISTVGSQRRMEVQIARFRSLATDDFRELVKQMNINPAMLRFLDGRENRAGNINENYARELMELFTLGAVDFAGEDNYSQRDVSEAARLLTGWQDGGSSDALSGTFQEARHDLDPKVVFAPDPLETPNQNPANEFTVGNLGEAEHRELVDRIFDHVDTEGHNTVSRFITRKLWRFFAFDPEVDVGTGRADLPLIDELAQVFRTGTPGDGRPFILGNLLKAMFLRTEFYENPGRTVKSPTEFVIGSVRKLAGNMPTRSFALFAQRQFTHPMAGMGQSLFEPPDVKGWDGNLAWISTGNAIARLEFARDLAERDQRPRRELGINLRKVLRWLPVEPPPTRAQIVAIFLRNLGPITVDEETFAALENWLGPDDGAVQLDDDTSEGFEFIRRRLRGLIALILTLPQNQVH